jgi:hypothetical protein
MNALRYVHLSSRDSGAGLEEVFIRRFRFEHGDSVYDGLRLFILVFLDQEAKRCSFLADAVGALSSFRQVQTLTGGKPATKQEVVKFPEPTPCKQLHQEAARAGFNSLAIQAISSAPGGALAASARPPLVCSVCRALCGQAASAVRRSRSYRLRQNLEARQERDRSRSSGAPSRWRRYSDRSTARLVTVHLLGRGSDPGQRVHGLSLQGRPTESGGIAHFHHVLSQPSADDQNSATADVHALYVLPDAASAKVDNWTTHTLRPIVAYLRRSVSHEYREDNECSTLAELYYFRLLWRFLSEPLPALTHQRGVNVYGPEIRSFCSAIGKEILVTETV